MPGVGARGQQKGRAGALGEHRGRAGLHVGQRGAAQIRGGVVLVFLPPLHRYPILRGGGGERLQIGLQVLFPHTPQKSRGAAGMRLCGALDPVEGAQRAHHGPRLGVQPGHEPQQQRRKAPQVCKHQAHGEGHVGAKPGEHGPHLRVEPAPEGRPGRNFGHKFCHAHNRCVGFACQAAVPRGFLGPAFQAAAPFFMHGDHGALAPHARHGRRDHRAALVQDQLKAHALLFEIFHRQGDAVPRNLLVVRGRQIQIAGGRPAAGQQLLHRLELGVQRALCIHRAAPPYRPLRHRTGKGRVGPCLPVRHLGHVVVAHQHHRPGGVRARNAVNPAVRAEHLKFRPLMHQREQPAHHPAQPRKLGVVVPFFAGHGGAGQHLPQTLGILRLRLLRGGRQAGARLRAPAARPYGVERQHQQKKARQGKQQHKKNHSLNPLFPARRVLDAGSGRRVSAPLPRRFQCSTGGAECRPQKSKRGSRPPLLFILFPASAPAIPGFPRCAFPKSVPAFPPAPARCRCGSAGTKSGAAPRGGTIGIPPPRPPVR